jgi:Zn ribbon nucleic-acid-binding protein
MSGVSGSDTCPICQEEMDTASDWKPFECVNGQCINCGFSYWTQTEQMDLEQVNELRAEHNENCNTKLKPLKQKDLKKWTEKIKEI